MSLLMQPGLKPAASGLRDCGTNQSDHGPVSSIVPVKNLAAFDKNVELIVVQYIVLWYIPQKSSVPPSPYLYKGNCCSAQAVSGVSSSGQQDGDCLLQAVCYLSLAQSQTWDLLAQH